MHSILLLRAMFAATYPLGKMLLTYIPPMLFVGSRMLVCGVIFLAWHYKKKGSLCVVPQDRLIFLQIALFRVYITYVLDTVAAQYVASHMWALIYTFAPFVTALITRLVLKERFSFKKIIGLSIGVAGCIPIAYMSNQVPKGGYVVPEVIMLLAMISYSYGWIITKKVVDRYQPTLINGVTMSVGGLGSLCTAPFFESYDMSSHNLLFWGALLVLVGFNIGCYQLYTMLLKYYSPTLLALAALLDPLIVALFSWYLFAEQISMYMLYALIFLGTGLYLFYQEEKSMVQPYA